jgi:hypothetical protein
MPDNPGFTVTDRRKFTLEGDLRDEGASPEPQTQSAPEPPQTPTYNSQARSPEEPDSGAAPAKGPRLVTEPTPKPAAPAQTAPAQTAPDQPGAPESDADDLADFPELTAAETAEQHAAYQRSSRDLDDMISRANPGARQPSSEMDFDKLVQSIYMTAAIQLGAGTQPGEQPRLDILGARQSIDMLNVLSEKTKGNLTDKEQRLLQNALFELRMTFLEITNAIAASAAQPHKPGPAR